MKFAVNTYSFARPIRTGEIGFFDIFKKASEMGFDGVEIVDVPPEFLDKLDVFAKKVSEEAKKYGLEISNWALDADFIGRDTEKEMRRLHNDPFVRLKVVL